MSFIYLFVYICVSAQMEQWPDRRVYRGPSIQNTTKRTMMELKSIFDNNWNRH